MDMKKFRLIISSPNKKHFDGEAESVILRGCEGDLAIFAGHIPFITTVVPGKCILTLADGTKKEGKIGTGLLAVRQEGVVITSERFFFTN